MKGVATRPGCDCWDQALEALEARLSFSAAAMDLVGLSAIRSHPYYSRFDGAGQTVVVIDQPIDWSSPYLAGRRVANIRILGTHGPLAGETHGTFVASIIGASDPTIGVAPGAGIIGVTSDGTEPTGSEGWRLDENQIERLLDWVIENRVRYNIVAVNMSIGDGRSYTSVGQVAERVLNDEIQELAEAGVVVVSSAGNGYRDAQVLGSAYPSIASGLAVGAVYAADVGPRESEGDLTTGVDRIAAFSQRPGTEAGNALFAPGAVVRGVLKGEQLGQGSGTSFATPYVTGAVAILQQAAMEIIGERLSAAGVIGLLRDSGLTIIDGDDEDDTVQNTGASYQRLNIVGALELLERRFSNSAIEVRGGGSLTRIIVHDKKALRPSGTGFGPVERDGAFKNSRLRVTNTGQGLLHIDGVRLRGQSPANFQIITAPSGALAPGESADLVVRFDPRTYGVLRAKVEITSSAAGQGVFAVRVKGRGVPAASAPDIVMTGATAEIRSGDTKPKASTGTDFGLSPIGLPVAREFTITNTGGSALTIDPGSVSISGNHAADFVVTSALSLSVIEPGQTARLTITFTPSATGVRWATVLLITNDPDETPMVFRVGGRGIE